MQQIGLFQTPAVPYTLPPIHHEEPTNLALQEEAVSIEDGEAMYNKIIGIENDKKQQLLLKAITDIAGPNLFAIKSDKVEQILTATCLTINQLLQFLYSRAKCSSLPAISNYEVGAAAMGKSGNIYLGVNIEFPGPALNQSIHGEQTLIANARNHQEEEIQILCLSAAPCGHCRQFLFETSPNSGSISVVMPKATKTISELLPDAFGPADLAKEGEDPIWVLTSWKDFDSQHECPLTARAIEAAYASYAPYTQAQSGVAIQTKDGNIYKGSYIENAAFNPSLSPLQTAIAVLVADGKSYRDIEEVTLVEFSVEKGAAKITQENNTREVLNSIAKDAKFNVVNVDSFF